jgi:uncharacterized protein YecT (DUF1311 family)
MLTQSHGMANTWNPYWIVLVMCTFAATAAVGASFDCNKAHTYRELTVCSQPELSTLDETLSKAYSDARASSESPDVLRQSQRTWLATADECRDAVCLASAYQTRIEQLQASTAGNLTDNSRTDDQNAHGPLHVDRDIPNQGAGSPYNKAPPLPKATGTSDLAAPPVTNVSLSNHPALGPERDWRIVADIAIIMASLAVLLRAIFIRSKARPSVPASIASPSIDPAPITPQASDYAGFNKRGQPDICSVPTRMNPATNPASQQNSENELLEIARQSWKVELLKP